MSPGKGSSPSESRVQKAAAKDKLPPVQDRSQQDQRKDVEESERDVDFNPPIGECDGGDQDGGPGENAARLPLQNSADHILASF